MMKIMFGLAASALAKPPTKTSASASLAKRQLFRVDRCIGGSVTQPIWGNKERMAN